MKRIGIAVTDPRDWTAQALYNAVTKIGSTPFMFRLHDVKTKLAADISITTGDLDLETLDAVIVRDVGGGGGEDLSYRFDVLCNLERSGVLIVNPPEAIQTAANKHMASYRFNKHDLPTPETLVTSDIDEAFVAIRTWGRAVTKPIFGFKGQDIDCLTDNDSTRQVLQHALDNRGVLYLQQYISNPGRDIRAFVVDDHVAGAIYRAAPKGSWISNLSRGGTPEPCTVTSEIEDMACGAAQAVGAVYAGVDLIEGPDGLSILEVNGTPSGRGIFEACGVDVAGEVVQCVVGRD
ncbi:MAG: RimK family alpha-L-glutamate ligase [Nitrospirae bacterium]|nr:RimK family alpha-L-glutamate ligase [Nitrospirota bacterium]